MGSYAKTLNESDWAYIAGFFDGDGSLMVQLKNRRDTSRGWRIMFTICFYQDSRHKEPLQWMQNVFGIGYLHDRNDGMTELKVNGYEQVKRILTSMQPYIRFKQQQVTNAMKMLEAMAGKKFLDLSLSTRGQLADWFNEIRAANYKSYRRKYSADEVKELLTR